LAVAQIAAPADYAPLAPAFAQQTIEQATKALFLAIDRNDLDAVREAVNNGADIEARDYTGVQPADLAIDRGFSTIARYLISVRNARQDGAQRQLPSAPQIAETPPQDNDDPFAGLSDDVLTTPSEAPPVPATPRADEPGAATMTEAPTGEDPFSDFTDHGIVETSEPQTGETPSDPFDVKTLDNELPVMGDVQEPSVAPKPPLQNPIANEPETAVIEPKPAPVASQAAQTREEPPITEGVQNDLQLTIDKPSAVQGVVLGKPAEPVEKASATKRFITTFFDFFKPPNVTGVVRKKTAPQQEDDTLSDEELARHLEQITAERGDEITKGPEVPINAEELAKELPPAPELPEDLVEELAAVAKPDQAAQPTPALPPYAVGSPTSPAPLPPQEEVFGDIAVEQTTSEENIYEGAVPEVPDFKEAPGVPGRKFDPSMPFGGGVDPDVLAYLGLDQRTGREVNAFQPNVAQNDKPNVTPSNTQDPFAAADTPGDNPFELVEGDKEAKVSELLEGLGEPQDVAKLEPKSPTSPAADDPFAAPTQNSDDPFSAPTGEVDELAGLLEGLGEKVQGTNGWDVKGVEGGQMPSEVVALSEIEPSGTILDGVNLTLGIDSSVGKEVGDVRLKLMEQETIHKPCLVKGGNDTMFCIDTLSWPFEMEEDFLVDTIMYQGTRAVVRYDAKRATNFLTLFRTQSFEKIINYYTQRYAEPTEIISRAIAPLGAPRQENPTYLWQSREPGTDTITTLEIRKFNDALGGGFPDTQRGVILLYRNQAKPIFPQLSQLELMVLKPDDVGIYANEANEKDNTDIWN